MGSNFDMVLVDEGVEFPESPLDVEPWEVVWQTKTFPDAFLRLHRLTEEGRLFRKRHEYQEDGTPKGVEGGYTLTRKVTEENVPVDRANDSPLHDEWIRLRVSGTVRIYSSGDDTEVYKFDLHFGPNGVREITYEGTF